nr:MAG: hypothetical protein DIU78_08450 [Pseudomonadota bacterium]
MLSGDAVWASAARSIALSTLLGFAVATFLKLVLAGSWVAEFLAENTLPSGRRTSLIRASVTGAIAGASFGAYWVWTQIKSRRSMAELERWLWFASPLLLLPAIPSLFRHEAWTGRYDRLLPIVLFLSIVLEVLTVRALTHAPGRARQWWAEARCTVPEIVRRRGPLVLVVGGALFYAAFFSFFLVRWHYKLRTGNFDLSINNNLMFGGLHGRILESTVVFPDDPGKYLANHAKFGGYLFLPIYALFPRAETLLVLQSILIGAGAIPLWAFARRHLPEWTATVLVLAYLAYYPMHGASFSEFQYVPIAAFFLFTTVWAAEMRRWVLFAISSGIALLLREDIPIGMALVGGFMVLAGYRPRAGLALAAVSLVYFLVLRFYVMNQAGDWWYPNMYKELWADKQKGFGSVIKTLISNPLYVFSKITVEKKVTYLLHLLVPLVFLPARRWYLWAAFIPGILLTLLITNYDPPITFSFHYVMHWAPFLFLAAILALRSIGSTEHGPVRRHAATLAVAFASLVLTFNYGAFAMRDRSFRGGFHKVEFSMSDAERQRYADLQSLIALIPDDASVAATEKVGPHVSSRLYMYTMRHGPPQNAEYILASSRELKLARTRPRLYEALKSGRYGVVRRVADFALMKRGHDTSGNAQLIRDWKLAEGSKKSRSKERTEREREQERERAPERESEPESESEPETSPEDESRGPG